MNRPLTVQEFDKEFSDILNWRATMTDTIELTKREMYEALAVIKYRNSKDWRINTSFEKFESALEAHFDELRKDLNFACSALDVETARRAKLVQERDDIQLRLHAIDHAYFVQSEANRIAGDELRQAKELIREQQEQLQGIRMLLEARKVEGAMLAQGERENVASASKAAGYGISIVNQQPCCADPLIYRDGCGSIHCRSCGA